MKKNIIMLLAALLLIFVGCNGEEEQTPDKEIDLWSVSNTVKVMQDFPKSEYEEHVYEATLDFAGIKGETESAQLIITPNIHVDSFNFEMADVIHENNVDKISKENFEVFVQKYIEVTQPSTVNRGRGQNGLIGWWPDAIIPINNYRIFKEDKITAGNNQGLWVNLNISRDAAPGNYNGQATLTINDKEYEIPVRVRIFDLVIPEEPHGKTAFAIWYNEIDKSGAIVNEDTYDTYYWFMANKRITPTHIPPVYSGAREFAEAVVEYAKKSIVSGYNIDYRGEAITIGEKTESVINYSYLLEVFNALIEKNIELWNSDERTETGEKINLFKKLYIYLGSIEDEPGPGKYPFVKETDRRITQAKLALKDRLADYPELQDSFMRVSHVVTIHFVEELYGTDETGGVQTWCPQAHHYNSESYRNESYWRLNPENVGREYGEEMWWYVCESPRNPYPSYHIDDNLISSRVIGWMQYEYRVTGSLYWSVNYASKYTHQGGAVSRDYWNDPVSWWDVNGDGFMTYPGKRYGLLTPISTVRLESIREGKEDYEYFFLLEDKIKEYNVQNGTGYDSREISKQFKESLYNGMIVNLDSKNFDQKRLEFLEFLEKLYQNPDEVLD